MSTSARRNTVGLVNLMLRHLTRKPFLEVHISPRPVFPAFLWFGSSHSPSPLPSASCFPFSVFLYVANRASWWERWEGGGGGRAKSYDGEKARSSIFHSVLSAFFSLVLHSGNWYTAKNSSYAFCNEIKLVWKIFFVLGPYFRNVFYLAVVCKLFIIANKVQE